MIKRNAQYVGLLVILMVSLSGCMPWFKKKLTGLVVVNVLDKMLYDDCHIAGSIHWPFEKIDTFFQELDPSAEVVFYCSNYMCAASGIAAKMLRDRGFEHVWAYEGGTAEWYQHELPVKGPCRQAYLKKKIAPALHDGSYPVIDMQELAKKMGVAYEAHENMKTAA